MIRKNKKFIDPRYFMDEKTEIIEEDYKPGSTSVTEPRVPRRLGPAGGSAFGGESPPHTPGGPVATFARGPRFVVYNAAGMNLEEAHFVEQILKDEIDSADFYGTPAYEKLFEYFAFSNKGDAQMPYGTAKARDGMPDEWILDYLQGV
jgi:hypothetical protein